MSNEIPTALNDTTKAIVFIDASLTDIPAILSGIDPSVTTIILDPTQNGLQQIADILTNVSDLDAIHIISHGASGQLKLGTALLSQATLNQYQSQLASLGHALSATGDLLLYGCNVAEGLSGQAFIEQLAALTGIDVAASDDLTGNTFSNANWLLEANTGTIESKTVVQHDIAGFGNNTLNTAPTLTTFIAAVARGDEDKKIEVTFAGLQSQSDAVDDGTVVAFVVQAISSGVLKIGRTALTALPWAASSNDTIDNSLHAYWMPDANANGTLNAFTVQARDDKGFKSVTPVQAQIEVTAIPDVNISADTSPIEGGSTGVFNVNLDSPAPVGGLTVNYTLVGSATLGADYTVTAGTNITALTESSFTVAEGQSSAVLNINALTDSLAESNEKITLHLTASTSYQLAIGDLSFATRLDYATGSVPNSVSIGDFNNDGKSDLVIANSNNNSISVLLRNATNTDFDTKVDYATGLYPTSVSAADFNNDGKTDLAVANSQNNNVSVLLRNATNTDFDTKIDYDTGAFPYSVNTGDFNNDGKTDLVVVNRDSSNVSILLRNATNTDFDTKIDYATGAFPYSVSVGDFNIDGKTDLAVTNSGDNTISVLLRNSVNTDFDAKSDYETGLNPTSASIGDFNNDGKADLAVVNSDSDSVSILLRDASNTGFEAKIDYAVGISPYSVTVGDLNNDGQTDLAVANFSSDNLSVLLRNTTNTDFNIKNYPTGLSTKSFSIGDFNDDGKKDLAIANLGTSTVSVLLNNSLASTARLSISDNLIPTLTHFTPITLVNENAEATISFADLLAQGDAADVDGTVTAFVVKAVSSGILRIGTSALAASEWNADNTIIDATYQAYWTPDINANGTLNAFTVMTQDNAGAPSATAVQVTVNIAAINDAPTLTAFLEAIPGDEDNPLTITFADLQNQGDEADVDGTVLAFVVETVSSGTLNIGGSAWDAISNNTINANHPALWTPDTNANGRLNAFKVFAQDDSNQLSSSAVQVTANITAINDAPTLTAFSEAIPGDEDNPLTITFADLQNQGDEADVDGTVTAFVVETVSSGTLNIGGSAWDAISNNTIDASQPALWTPDTNANNLLNAFTVKAKDNSDELSSTAVQVTANIAAVNDAPTGIVIITGTPNEGQVLTASNTLQDADGLGVISYTWQTETKVLATGKSYALTKAVVDKTITVTASYLDLKGNEERVTSAATSEIIPLSGDNELSGSVDSDTLNGGAGQDTMMGGAGTDSMIGGRGDDSLFGGAGQDTMAGGAGTDSMIGGFGNDSLYGGAGQDTMAGGAGTDALTGGLGNDSLSGGKGKDTLNGGTGSDDLSGGKGNDSLSGGAGNDHLFAGNGADFVDGGNGKDEIVGGVGFGNDTYIGGNGEDTVKYTSAISSITVNLALGTAKGKEINNDQLNLIENIIGGQAGDVLIGNDHNNSLDGYTGNDTLKGGAGSDTLTGGLGNDTYVIDSKKDIVIESSTLANELDTIQSPVSYSLPDNVEKLTLTGSAAINGNGNDLANKLFGNKANNVLNGGTGGDMLSGGLGNDTYIIDNPRDVAIESSALLTEIDSVESVINYTLKANFENLTLKGTAAINGAGNTLTNTLKGNAGNNVLDGGESKDVLTGGAGADKFRFTTTLTADPDRITDFSVIDDTLQLENNIFTKLTSTGVLNKNNFIVAAKAADHDDYMVYNKASGILFYDADGNGSDSAMPIATLGTNVDLTKSDIFVI